MGVRIEGRVMVHRTDIAGGSAGSISPGNGRVCRRKRNGALLANSFSLKRKATLSSADDGSPVPTTAAQSVHAIHFGFATPGGFDNQNILPEVADENSAQ